MKEISGRGKIICDEKGRYQLVIDNDLWWKGELSKFEPGTIIVASVKRWYKKRSLSQNGLFHKYCEIFGDYLGYDKDEMKEEIRRKFLKEPLLNAQDEQLCDLYTGELLWKYRSTASLNTQEMFELTENVRIWALTSFNVVLPLPEEQQEMPFRK